MKFDPEKHNPDWKYDLKIGKEAEAKVLKLLSSKGDAIEVKHDLKALETGNLFIEYENRGVASGLAVTESDWHVFVLSENLILFISTKRLKEICRPFYKTDKDILGGDFKASKGILLPITELFNESKK